ncbi:MAG: CHAT domain-containing protein [Paludibacteraceae bacterium]|nr:CHAT domain-containing protein [Paludibacteraceae bacterium]
MKRYFIILCALLSTLIVSAQSLSEQEFLERIRLSYDMIHQHRYADAIDQLQEVINLTDQKPSWQRQAYSTMAQCYSFRAMDSRANNRAEEAISYSTQVIDYALKGGEVKVFIGEHIALATAYLMLHELPKAEESIVLAYTYNEQLHSPDSLKHLADIAYTFAELCVANERYNAAVESYEEAFSRYYDLDTPNSHQRMLSVAQAVATLYRYRLFNEEKAAFWEQMLAEVEQEYRNDPENDDDPMLARMKRRAVIVKMAAEGNHEESAVQSRLFIAELLAEDPVDHATIAELYQHLGTCYIYLHRYEESVAAYQAALEHLPKTPASVEAVECYYYMAIAHYHNDNYQAATESAQRAVDLAQEIYDEDSYRMAETYELLANMQAFNGDFDHAKQYLLRMKQAVAGNIRRTFSYMTAQERENYWAKLQQYVNEIQPFLLRMNEQQSEYTDALYDVQLLSKSLLLQSEVELQRVVEGAPQLRQHIEQLTHLKQLIAQEQLPPDSIHVLKLQAEMIEQQLVAESGQIGDYLHFLDINHHDIHQALPAHTAAVEFATFRYRKDSLMTVAYVMKPEWEHVRLVPLFEQREWDALPARDIYTSPDAFQLVWAPILEAVGTVDTLYFAPSGSLYNTAIEYLPDMQDRPICDRLSLIRLSSTRQLALQTQPADGQRAVLFGGLRYANGSKWRYLQSSLAEVQTIAKILRRPQLFTSDKGTEAAFSQLSGTSCNVLHVATHGFANSVPQDRQQDLHSPLRYCGLILSRGGDAKGEIGVQNDGILTAQELSLMDLSQCHLAVLSACRTAQGVVSSDGVLGLQRGLKMAGAKTVILSLWDVNDQATQLLMTEFYRHHIVAGMPVREAFRRAQQTVRRTYEEPEYWAAFILID